MIAERRLDLAGTVARYAATRDHATIADIIRELPAHAVAPERAQIAAALRAAGFERGFVLTRKPNPQLILYENWLQLAIRRWALSRAALTIGQFLAAHPDFPSCHGTRREIAWGLTAIGYTRAYVRP